jgi:hypothetical protein
MVCKINKTWIVRHGLEGDADEYLMSLVEQDPARLIQSCKLVMAANERAVTDAHIWQLEDPKSFFYPSLFYYSNPGERQKWLKTRPFTLSVVNALQRGKLTRWKNCHLRKEVTGQTQVKMYMVVGLIKQAVGTLEEKEEVQRKEFGLGQTLLMLK